MHVFAHPAGRSTPSDGMSSKSPKPRSDMRRLLGGGTAAAALAMVSVTVFAGSAAAATVDTAGAASYVVSQLAGGNHVEIGGFAYDGAAVDALVGLVAAGGNDASVAAIGAYLPTAVDAYADPTGKAGGPYSGSLAKLALAAETLGSDPHAFGGTDVLGILQNKTCDAAAVALADGTCNAVGEFYNSFVPISQALGVIALDRSPVAGDHLTSTSAPVARLLALQCTDGGFGSSLSATTPCATGDPDTTSYAVQALASVNDQTAATAEQVGLTYLAKAQGAGGGLSGASGVNANSTGLALAAFSLSPTTFATNITAATNFLAALQGSDGGLAVNQATPGSNLLATAQALLGISGRNLADSSLVSEPAGPTPTASPPQSPTPTASPPQTPTPTASGVPSASVSSSATGGRVGAGTGSGQLAATGAAGGHLSGELTVAAAALLAGVGLTVAGRRRNRSPRHRA